MLFPPHKGYLNLNVTDFALKVSLCLSIFTASISHGVFENISPGCGVWPFLMILFSKLFVCPCFGYYLLLFVDAFQERQEKQTQFLSQ